MAAEESAIKKKLREAGQLQVYEFVDRGLVSAAGQAKLEEQIAALDLHQLNELFETSMAKHHAKILETTNQTGEAGGQSQTDGGLLPPPAESVGTRASLGAAAAPGGELETLGRGLVAKGQVAAVILGGGAGTRLGLDGPKGLFALPGLPSGKSLYQLFAERVLSLKNSTGAARLPFIVMTSPLNHAATVAFFEENGFFGLPAEHCLFFEQGTLPAFSREGKLILEDAHTLGMSPDGNGGIYPSLAKSGVLQKCKEWGIRYLHVAGVDNVLLRPADPLFLGFCESRDAAVGNKSVWKSHRDEKVGVIGARRGGGGPGQAPAGELGFCVVEYSEMSEAQKGLADPATGKLIFGAGNICNHVFRLDFLLDTVLPNYVNLYHVAEKRVPFADPAQDGRTAKPSAEEKTNGVKLEAFIFDVFPLAPAGRFAVLECLREEEFAPVKNGSGTDSPATALAMLRDLHHEWIKAAGGTVVIPPTTSYGNGDAGENSAPPMVEVSPLLSLAGEGLEAACRGKTFVAPCEIK
eukprot:gene272-334_t